MMRWSDYLCLVSNGIHMLFVDFDNKNVKNRHLQTEEFSCVSFFLETIEIFFFLFVSYCFSGLCLVTFWPSFLTLHASECKNGAAPAVPAERGGPLQDPGRSLANERRSNTHWCHHSSGLSAFINFPCKRLTTGLASV